nr:TGS domain-containing protein [Lachnospiraceae bacterium]
MFSIGVNGVTKQYAKGTTYGQVAADVQREYDSRIALAIVNGKFRELSKEVEDGATVSFLTYSDSAGHKCYVRTATMIMMKAINDVMIEDKPEKVKVEFAIGKGYYVSIISEHAVTDETAKRVEKRMREIVEASIPVEKQAMQKEDAIKLFEEHGMMDKVNLFRFRRSSLINVYNIGDYYDYYYGYMLPSTDYISYFGVEAYEGGFILNLPGRKEPDVLSAFEPREKLFRTLCQADEWGRKMGIDTVGDLNGQICAGKLNDLILVQEAFQEKRIAEIAHDIAERGGVKFVMIAGPSSSGKTTFSHRLSIQLRAQGLTPHPIALDDYFVNREDTPLDENGDYNFECLGAIDVELFNRDMSALLAGEEVELPTFNFKTGHREYKGNKKKLGPDDILVLEGIHGLNDKMSYSLPNSSKYKIYISALTSLNVDEHNRIPTTDGRLLRRMVRDARTRGASAKRTIQMWPSVRRGEEENIFPFQEKADAFFNSALIYELAVLKQFAEPLLFSITPEDPEYHEAKRLLKFLEYFLGVSSEHLPNNSIVREFVGGSCFPV